MIKKNLLLMLLIASGSVSAAGSIPSHGIIKFQGSIVNTPCNLSSENLHRIAENNQPSLAEAQGSNRSRCVKIDDTNRVTYALQPDLRDHALQTVSVTQRAPNEKTFVVSYN
ncbi:hypothetical protein [Pseudomonas protegens]|uniref:hypothetical protein n=1 Tax=Pseudomonas protegens TaxID=380021 RepID=UPI002282401E|nr:hypothetical protein [Pseudomonas protegens]MCY7261889.1 hypothetical protein [Pseudomonas protegens]